MILVTGGLGFIGLHTVRALLDLGESCILTQHQTARCPEFIRAEIGQRVFIEQVDITDQKALFELNKRYQITGIVHLAGPGMGALGLFDNLRVSMEGLLNVLQAVSDWRVRRVSIASAIGVYMGVEANPFREDVPLPMTAIHPIQTVKKSSELLAAFVASQAGFEVINLRIGAIWGPLGRPTSSFFPTPRLIHGAVKGETVDLSTAHYAEDGLDMCYVKDCGRAIALLQLSQKLNYSTYNVGSGRPTRNKEVISAIRQVIPDAQLKLGEGFNPHSTSQDLYLDITRLQEDTGYQPAYNTERGVADYIEWLRAGNER